MRSCVIIGNPNAGKWLQAAGALERLVATLDCQMIETKSREHAEKAAQDACERGAALIVSAGGDGTLNSVVNGMLRSAAQPSTLGILPIGTANDFAATLAVPDDLYEAVDLLRNGERRPIDIIELHTGVELRRFANVAAGGNSDRVTQALTDDIKHTWGPLCYLRGAVGVLSHLQSYDLQITFDDDHPLHVDVWNVLIANGRTNAGRLVVAPRANPEDGLLDVILIRDGDFIDLATLTARFVLSDYLDCEQIIYRQAKKVRVRSTPGMRYSIDGEAIEGQPIEFRVLPAAIRMVVGQDYQAQA